MSQNKNPHDNKWQTTNRGTVPSLHVNGLRVSAKSSVSRGHLAVFMSEHSDEQGAGGAGRSLGLASGSGGLAWQDGALQNVRLGGTTKLEGDLDVGGHRLLNFDLGTRDLENVEVREIPAVSLASNSDSAASCSRFFHRVGQLVLEDALAVGKLPNKVCTRAHSSSSIPGPLPVDVRSRTSLSILYKDLFASPITRELMKRKV